MDNEMIQEDGAAIEEPTEDKKSAPYKICVVPYEDGTFAVYKESMESAEPVEGESPIEGEAPAEPSEEMHHECSTMEEALKKVIKLHRENPVLGDEQSAFSAAGKSEAASQGY